MPIKSNPKQKIIQLVSYAGLLYALTGWLNEVALHWVESLWLSHYSEYIAIGIFGLYRTAVEKNPYTRKRVAVLTGMVVGFWGLLPYVWQLREPAWGYFGQTAVWGTAVHLPMTLTFFIALLLVVLFGRRAVCSWNCPCVGSRDTMGAAFRRQTIKSKPAWRMRHLKWVPTAFYLVLMIIVLVPWSRTAPVANGFIGLVGVVYFASFLFIPLTGNRNWCRWLCPYGGVFGLLNRVGFYSIKADRKKCIACGKCNRACDMGIPVQELVQSRGEVNVAECVGCGRCITECKAGALQFCDIRSYIKKRTV